jgi:hypothetical protein
MNQRDDFVHLLLSTESIHKKLSTTNDYINEFDCINNLINQVEPPIIIFLYQSSFFLPVIPCTLFNLCHNRIRLWGMPTA